MTATSPPQARCRRGHAVEMIEFRGWWTPMACAACEAHGYPAFSEKALPFQLGRSPAQPTEDQLALQLATAAACARGLLASAFSLTSRPHPAMPQVFGPDHRPHPAHFGPKYE